MIFIICNVISQFIDKIEIILEIFPDLDKIVI